MESVMKVVVPLALAVACLSLAAPASAVPVEGPQPSLASAKGDPPGKAKGQEKNKGRNGSGSGNAGRGGASKGGNPPSHSNGRGRDQAPGQARTSSGGTTGGSSGAAADGRSRANPRSENENEKITYCHVPPGNPTNGHPITTSVNAIDPGHLNHPEDVIPPYEYAKHGRTVTFAGQNWGPEAQAYVDAGCVTAPTDPAGSSTPAAPGDEPQVQGQVAGVSVAETAGRSDDEGFLDAVLPSTGGARLGLLLAALALVGGGAALVLRRRRAG
jgi:LPXTG-motif cell wall-anchored protein